MDTHALALLCHLLSHPVNQFVIIYRTQSHLIWISDGFLHAHGQPPFRVNADHQRRFRQCLPRIGLVHLSLGIGAEKTHATDVVLFDVLRHIFIKRLVGLVGTQTNQLAHALLQTKAVIHRIHPARFRILGKTLAKCKGQSTKNYILKSIHNYIIFKFLNYSILTIPSTLSNRMVCTQSSCLYPKRIR